MKYFLIIASIFLVWNGMQAQVTLSTDFTSEELKKEPLYNIWSVANRISPTNGSNVRPDLKVNLVRMIGGIKKVVDGQNVPDLDYDPCYYDSINNIYVYNWDPLISRLDKIVNSPVEIHQIVLDQPPWAFQYGYTFIPAGTRDSIHFREDERVTHYGNSLPPADKVAYHDFIKALMTKLVDTYGEELVLSWRFRVGSEIETPDHWRGTEQDFIEHFANTEQAVRAILPNAKIGVHTRIPGFLYKDGTVLNYKGQPFKSFVNGIIEYSYDNNIQYDFWGISDYVLINNPDFKDMKNKYQKLFSKLLEHPEWNADAKLDLMEYSTVTTMDGADGKGFITCETSHKEIVELGFAQQFYKNADKGLEKIYRWGNRPNSSDPINIEVLNTMNGKLRYETELSGTPLVTGNDLDAIFGKKEGSEVYDALVYNFNVNSLDYVQEEDVVLSFAINQPAGSVFYYRSLSYGKENNKLQSFLENEPASGWVKDGFDPKGDYSRILNEKGLAAFNSYTNPNPAEFSGWKSVVSNIRTDGKPGSEITISTKIPSFAFQKFEFRPQESFVKPISPTKVIWTSSEDFSPWKAVSAGMEVVTDDDKLTLNFSDGFGFPMAAITGLNINSDLFDTLRLVVKNTTEKASVQMAANVPGTEFSTGRKLVTLPNDGEFHNVIIDISEWALWNGKISEFKMYNSVNSGSIIIDTMEFISSSTNTTYAVTLELEGNGILNYESGTCFEGQEFTLNAIAEEGWGFESWTGDITGSENPVNITVNSDMSIKAVFKEIVELNLVSENGFVKKVPDQMEYLKGQSVQLIPIPDFGYRFSDWSGDYQSSEDTITILMDSSINIVANFVPVPAYEINIVAENGKVYRTPFSEIYNQGTSVELRAEASPGYRFVNWTGDVLSYEETITVIVDSTIHLVAHFELIPYYTLTVIQENGNVLISPNKTSYKEGELVYLLSVTPDEGYEFTGWSGDTTGRDVPLVLTMDSDITIIANFTLITAVSEFKNEKLFVFPNPGKNGIFFLNESRNWSIYSLTGVHILSGETSTIDISMYAKGVYILKTEKEEFRLIRQ